MRLIDADALPISFDGHTVSVWKKDLDAASTINPYEWISVEDRLPNEEGDYLVLITDHCDNTRMEVMKLFKWANCFDWSAHMSSFWERYNTITHWMYLPEPPKD